MSNIDNNQNDSNAKMMTDAFGEAAKSAIENVIKNDLPDLMPTFFF